MPINGLRADVAPGGSGADGRSLGNNPSAHLAVWMLTVDVEFMTSLGEGSSVRAEMSAVYAIL